MKIKRNNILITILITVFSILTLIASIIFEDKSLLSNWFWIIVFGAMAWDFKEKY